MKSILPEHVTIKLHDAFASTKRSFEKFNEYIKAQDLQKLIDDMDRSPHLFDLWKSSLNKALKQARKSDR